MISAILLAGGKGHRMMNQVPKQYLLIAGKPMIMHSLDRLDMLSSVDDIIIVCEYEYIPHIKDLIKQYSITKPITFALSGQTRQESVYNGLCKVNNESVIIHESARPFVTTNYFEKIIYAEEKNVTFGIPIPFTVLIGNKYIEEKLDREQLVNIQLPQKFDTKLLLQAHKKAILDNKTFTEDASLLFHYFHTNIMIIEGESYNIKITDSVDLCSGEEIYKKYIVGRV